MAVVAHPRVRESVGETPSGPVDGANRVFSTFRDFVSGTTRLYLNGLRQSRGTAEDYVESSSSSVTFVRAPRVDDKLIIDYYF
jgi:hypothetical protein